MLSEPEKRANALEKLRKLGRVSVPLAASILNRHPVTIREWCSKGKLRPLRIGSRDYITQDEFERFWEEEEN